MSCLLLTFGSFCHPRFYWQPEEQSFFVRQQADRLAEIEHSSYRLLNFLFYWLNLTCSLDMNRGVPHLSFQHLETLLCDLFLCEIIRHELLDNLLGFFVLAEVL